MAEDAEEVIATGQRKQKIGAPKQVATPNPSYATAAKEEITR
jgi:hypothetical protein